MQDDTETAFASLLASRLCHDLINPAGALRTALDVLDTETDQEMRQHAESLMRESTDRMVAVIEYARLAYGASGGGEGEMSTEQMRDVATRLFAHLKPELRWHLETPGLPKSEGRVLLNLLLTTERIAPRAGSAVTVVSAGQRFALKAEGRKAAVPDDVAAAFRGEGADGDPKLMPARLAYNLAAAAGKRIVVESQEEAAIITLAAM